MDRDRRVGVNSLGRTSRQSLCGLRDAKFDTILGRLRNRDEMEAAIAVGRASRKPQRSSIACNRQAFLLML